MEKMDLFLALRPVSSWDKATEIEKRGTAKFKDGYKSDQDTQLSTAIDYIYRVSELKIGLANAYDEIYILKKAIAELKKQVK